MTARGSALGLGWSHNYDLKLDLSGEAAPTKTLIFQAAHGTPFKFAVTATGYQAAIGVHATLTRTEVTSGSYQYLLKAAHQATYIFNQTGQIVSQSDPHGNVLRYTYDMQGRLTQVMDVASQRYLAWSYNAEGQLTQVTDSGGRVTGFNYNSENRLISVTDTRNKVWQYNYVPLSGGQQILARVTDPDGRVVEATAFDNWGRAISQTYQGQYVGIAYYEDGRRVITDGLGRVVTHSYNNLALIEGVTNSLGQREQYAFDAQGNRNFKRDGQGKATYYEYNAAGQVTTLTDALGQITRYYYDTRNNLVQVVDALGRSTHYGYDDNNNLLVITDALGQQTVYTYNPQGQKVSVTDAKGQTTYYGYDAVGNLVQVTDALGQVTHYEYDDLGRLVRLITPQGKITVNEYDGADNLVRVIENYRADLNLNAQNQYNLVTEYSYDGAGHRLTVIDPLGRMTRYIYNNAGQLSQTWQNVHPTVTTVNYQHEYNLLTQYQYDGAGNRTYVTDPLGRRTRTKYDELNRVKQVISNHQDGVYDATQPDQDVYRVYNYDAAGNLVSEDHVLLPETRHEYDALNRLVRRIELYQDGVHDTTRVDADLITTYQYDAVGNRVAVMDTLGRVTRYSYDKLNRLQSTTNPMGGVTTYQYDAVGNRVGEIDVLGQVQSYQYDGVNRLVGQTDALGGHSQQSYDLSGNLSQMTNVLGQITSYEYDSLGRQIKVTLANGAVTRYEYDVLGRRLAVIDGLNQKTQYSYDSLDRMVESVDAQGAVTRWRYDELGNQVSVVDARGYETGYGYDRLNRLVVITEANGGVNRAVYNGLGQVIQVQNGADEITRFNYDKAQRLTHQIDPLGRETRYVYNSVGQRRKLIAPNGVTTDYRYDELDRLTRLVENHLNGVYDTQKPDEDIKTEYDYNALGLLVKVTDAKGQSTHYGYDALQRRVVLTDALNQVTYYGYDALGNLTEQLDPNGTTTSYQYDLVNQLTTLSYSDGTPSVYFNYDLAGRRVSMSDDTGLTQYIYDPLNRLTSVTNGAGQTVGYGYDAVGNRNALTYPDGSQVSYQYDGVNRLQSVTDWQNQTFSYHYDGANRLVGLALPNGVTSTYRYDTAGQLVGLSHQVTGTVLADYRYGLDAIGNRIQVVEGHLTEVDWDDNLLVNGGFETGDFTGWELPYAGMTVITGARHTGNYGAKLTQRGRIETTFATVPGEAYEVLGQVRLDGVVYAATWGGLWVQVIDLPTEQLLGYSVGFNQDNTPLGEWQAVQFTFTAVSTQTKLIYSQFANGNFLASADEWVVRPQREARQVGGRIAYKTYLPLMAGGGSKGWRSAEVSPYRLALELELSWAQGSEPPVEPPMWWDGQVRRQQRERRMLTAYRQQEIGYQYDRLSRLKVASYADGQEYRYSYDQVGNRLQQIINGQTTSYQYDAANRLVSSQSASQSTVFSFDANGNLLHNQTITNTWDGANRLVETGHALSLPTTFSYDGLGNRVGQTVGTTTTNYTLDVAIGLAEVIFTSEGHKYLHLPGVIMTQAQSQTRYLLSDGLGSIRQVVDEQGAVVAGYEYDPYGNPIGEQESGYGYTGEFWQSELGLLHLRARWYDPSTGSFLSKDPFEGFADLPATRNGYNYVHQNPINHTDPSGKILDTLADAAFLASDFGFVGYDLYRLSQAENECEWQNIKKDLGWDLLALGADAGATLIPFVTGGGLIVRVAAHGDDVLKLANHGDDVLRLANHGDEVVRVLYHGTDNVSARGVRKGIDLMKGELKKDFNPMGKRGFYVTEDLDQAMKWARRRANDPRVVGNIPVVLKFEIPAREIQQLRGKVFQTATREWSKFVRDARKEILQHSYDYVEGPMLAKVNDAVLAGIEPTKAIGHQLAIYTDEAVAIFNQYLKP